MGASESSARSNGTREEEEEEEQREPHQENNRSMGTATAIATAAAGVAVAAWGISRMLSDNTDTQQRNRQVTEPSLPNSPGFIYESRNPYSIWSPPSRGRYKMNTDGACHPTPIGPSGYGGILRDHNGDWVGGFIGFIGESDSFTAELYGILKGLEFLDKLNLKGAILEADHQSLCNVHVKGDGKFEDAESDLVRKCWPMIERCRYLRDKNEIEIKHIDGENANQCADKLAAWAVDDIKATYVELKINDLPQGIRELIKKDAKF